MTAVLPSPARMTFNLSDQDLARHLLLGEQLDPSLSQEFAGLPSVDYSTLMNPEIPSPAEVKQHSDELARSVACDQPEDLPEGQSETDSDAESVDSDGNEADDTHEPETTSRAEQDRPANLPVSGAIPASSSIGMLPTSSAMMMPIRATSPPPIRVGHPMPQTSQGFIPLTDLNTASGQANSLSHSSSPSSARAGASSMLAGSAKAVLPLGKRKAEQTDLDTILDPAEKKKQRRLAKNRATAALSRERKKAQLQVLQQRVRTLEQENTSLSHALSMRDAEIRRLKDRAVSQPKGVECHSGPTTTEVAKNPGPRIVYPAVSSLPRIYRSVANPPSSSFPYQPRQPPSGSFPVGATTHYPQRSVFSAPILDHTTRSQELEPSVNPSQPPPPLQAVPVSQSIHQSQSVQQSQSVPQSRPPSGAVAPSDSAQQEASSHQVISQQAKPHAKQASCQPEPSVSIQTPFNVVTSGESQPIKRQGSSKSSPEKAKAPPLARNPTLDGSFSKQISPFLAQADHQVHIQQAPNPITHGSAVSTPAEGPNPQQSFQQGNLSRSGSFTYASAYPPSCFPYPTGQAQAPTQDPSGYPSNMHSLISTQGSSAWGGGGASQQPQYPLHQLQQRPQQQTMSMQSWPGYDEGAVRTSPRHPGAWEMPNKFAPSMDGGQVSYNGGSSQWDLQRPGSSQYSSPSTWQDQQAWQQAHQSSDVSGSWNGSAHPPWPPQAIAVTPHGSVFGHTVGPLTETHHFPGDLDTPLWVNQGNPALAGMFPGQ